MLKHVDLLHRLGEISLPVLLLLGTCSVRAQSAAQGQGGSGTESASEETAAFLNHAEMSRLWLSAQINMIFQWHPAFRARYGGDNSLRPLGEHAASQVLSLYLGAEVAPMTEIFCTIETAGGRGLSDALGLAGFTNLDVVRNPTLGARPYLARLMLRKIFRLSQETVSAQRNPFGLATGLPARRIEVRAGKLSTADFFDLNAIGSDSRSQFLNWTMDNNGAYDYAADTRGYTWGIVAEYQAPNWGARFGEMLMPTVANGIKMDWNLRRARAENLEIELRRHATTKRPGVLRLLSYINHANMGRYQSAIDAFLAGRDKVPEIEKYRMQGRVKYGFGANVEQSVAEGVRLFGRVGWNDGKNESFAYTEVDRSVAFGGDMSGSRWGRKLDKIGVAFGSNAISRDHRRYLALGGKGFLLGDGGLTYGRENIVESYYNFHLWRGLYAAFDLQRISNPGYNRDRGPVLVPGLRFHVEF